MKTKKNSKSVKVNKFYKNKIIKVMNKKSNLILKQQKIGPDFGLVMSLLLLLLAFPFN